MAKGTCGDCGAALVPIRFGVALTPHGEFAPLYRDCLVKRSRDLGWHKSADQVAAMPDEASVRDT